MLAGPRRLKQSFDIAAASSSLRPKVLRTMTLSLARLVCPPPGFSGQSDHIKRQPVWESAIQFPTFLYLKQAAVRSLSGVPPDLAECDTEKVCSFANFMAELMPCGQSKQQPDNGHCYCAPVVRPLTDVGFPPLSTAADRLLN